MQLPLWAYLLVSAAAIALIALMVRVLRPGAPSAMTPDRAKQAFRAEFPDAAADSIQMSADGQTFLVLNASGGIVGVMTLVGLRWTPRRLAPSDVASARADGSRLVVSTTDFTWPWLTADWPDARAAQDWAARFNALRMANHA